MSDVLVNEPLVNLAEKIRQHTQRLTRAMWVTVERMRSIGDMLGEAKRICGPHRRWLPFLKYCGIPERHAQECMQIAKRWPEIEANTNNRSDSTLTEVRQLMTEVRQLMRPQRQKALEHPSKTRSPNAVVVGAKKKKKSAAVTNRSEPRRDHEAHLETEERPVPEPASHDPVDEQQDTQGASAASVQNTDDDASWLDSLPLRTQLENAARFDEEAKLWRSKKPLMDQVRDGLSPSAAQIGRGAIATFAQTSYVERLIFAAFVKPPSGAAGQGSRIGPPPGRAGGSEAA